MVNVVEVCGNGSRLQAHLTFKAAASTLHPTDVKTTDDYQAKLKLWAAKPTVAALPRGPRLPRFSPKRFATHAEMNRWKEALLLQMARERSVHG